MTPTATRVDTAMDCQNEKNRIPLTQRNLGTGLKAGRMNLDSQKKKKV